MLVVFVDPILTVFTIISSLTNIRLLNVESPIVEVDKYSNSPTVNIPSTSTLPLNDASPVISNLEPIVTFPPIVVVPVPTVNVLPSAILTLPFNEVSPATANVVPIVAVPPVIKFSLIYASPFNETSPVTYNRLFTVASSNTFILPFNDKSSATINE